MNFETTSPESPQLSYLNIAISDRGLAELAANRAVIFIPKERVQSVEIRFGLQAERPVIQCVSGLLLASLGAYGIFLVATNGLVTARWGLGFIFFGGLGVWLIWEALKRRHYLKVIGTHDSRKLIFRGLVQEKELDAFIIAATQFGYNFRDCSKD